MANNFIYKEKTINVGDSVNLIYKIKEGDKERQQAYKGIIIRVKGNDANNRMITIRKISRSGIGIERIIPLISSNIVDITVTKETSSRKSKIYYVRNLTESETRFKLYRKKTATKTKSTKK